MPTLHIVIEKAITFRGKPERYGNGYTLQSTSAFTSAFVKSVADALVTMERSFTYNNVTFPYRVGGPLGEDAVYAEEVASPPAGLQPITGETAHPEICALAQSKFGPKRYLAKYYHGSCVPSSAMNDAMPSVYKTRLETALVKLTDGTLPGAATYCRPNGDLATAPFTIDPWIRVHQLKRRGKRPQAASAS
jgi:hypothetical protein